MAKKVLTTQETAGIQAVDAPTLFSQAPLYELAPVIAHRRPMREKLYAAIDPMPAMSAAAGMAADGALPNAAIPKNTKVLILDFMTKEVDPKP